MAADPKRIHELEYELGFRDDAPAGSTQSPSEVSSVIKEVWTDDYASSIAGPGTHIAALPNEPFHWIIRTDGHDVYTTVHIEPSLPTSMSSQSFAALVSLEFDAALNDHRDRLRGSPPQWDITTVGQGEDTTLRIAPVEELGPDALH